MLNALIMNLFGTKALFDSAKKKKTPKKLPPSSSLLLVNCDLSEEV